MALDKQNIQVPLAQGINTKAESKALQLPSLAACDNANFDEVGGIRKREAFKEITDHADNTISNIRRLAVYGDELVAFTDTELYSYSTGDGRWTKRSDYLAPVVTEKARLVDTSEQYDCDRAELNGVVMFIWVQNVAGTALTHVAGLDAVSGALLLGPAAFGAGSTKMRLVATTNRIAAVYAITTPAIRFRLYDPADLSSADVVDHAVGSAVISLDVVSSGTTIAAAAQLTSGTSYEVALVNETPTVTASSTKARACDGPISVDIDVDGAVAVSRVSGTDVLGDFLTSALADNGVSIALGTASGSTVNQLTVKYKTTQDSGQYRAYSFWSSDEGTTGSLGNFILEYNWCSDVVTLGSKTTLKRRVGVASQAFEHNSEIYVWSAFGMTSTLSTNGLQAQLQNAYFLLRYDGLIVAKAAKDVGGGYAHTRGMLPGVQSLGGNKYAFCGVERGVIHLGKAQKGYAARSPREVVLEFDSNEARRTTMLGRTLYVTGGQVMQYDGRNCVEVSFPVFTTEISAVPVAGALTGTYFWKQTFGWYNAKGELDEGTTATYYDGVAPSSQQVDFAPVPIHITAKTGDAGEVFVQYWRNEDSAGVGAPFYLVTNPDPTSTGDNKFIENDPTASSLATWTDDMPDATLLGKKIDPETGGILENLAPPAAKIVEATQDRIFLAGVSDAPHRVVYSKLRDQGSVAAFNDGLAFELPTDGGVITGLGFLNETLIVFKERAIYALPGDGYDNAGGGQNYGPARLLSSDVGASSADSIALTPKGLLFHSSKGWYMLNRGWNATYVGGPVSDYDTDTFVATHVMAAEHQVRCVSTSRILVWDYYVDQWSVWTESGIVDSVVWNDVHHYTDGTVIRAEQTADWDTSTPAGLAHYGLDIETPWIKLAGLQGFQRLYEFAVLGEYRGACSMRIQVAYDYNEAWVDDKTWTVSPAVIGDPLQVSHGPSRPKCQAVKIRISARNPLGTGACTTEAYKLTGLDLRVGLKRGIFKKLPKAQKQ